MSLILEALRKSEAERRRGELPDLHSRLPASPARPTRAPALWPLFVLALILLASAWLIWSADQGESAAARGVADAPPAAVDEEPRIVTPPRDELSPRGEGGDGTAPSPVKAPSAVQIEPRTAPVRQVANEPSPGATGLAPAQPSAPRPPVATAPSGPRAASSETTVALPEPPPPAAPVEPVESLPSLASLDAATRAAFPPLKVSMHVYSDAPGQRFAIVDGKRVGEGALLGPGVVESIRRDGVVLQVNGRRLLLPKP